jgi:hypothetical protein
MFSFFERRGTEMLASRVNSERILISSSSNLCNLSTSLTFGVCVNKCNSKTIVSTNNDYFVACREISIKLMICRTNFE